MLELSLFLFCWLELTTKALERSCRIVGATPSSRRKLTLNKNGNISSVCKQNLCQLPKNYPVEISVKGNKRNFIPVLNNAISKQAFRCSTSSTKLSYGKLKACCKSWLAWYPPLAQHCFIPKKIISNRVERSLTTVVFTFWMGA